MNAQAQEALGYATLLLHTAEAPITTENIKAVLEAAGIEVMPIYMSVFSKFFQNHDIESMMQVGGSAAQAQVAAGDAAPAASEKVAEKKVEEAPEEDDDMGFGLFD